METVSTLMTEGPLVTVGPDTTVAQAAKLIAERGVSHLMVTRAEEFVGVVCICDLDGATHGAKVGELMHTEPLTAAPTETAGEAMRRMRSAGVSCMPVLAGRTLKGVVTVSDLERGGYAPDHTGIASRCAACGSDDHVRTHPHMEVVGFCIECRRSSAPPSWDDDLGGG